MSPQTVESATQRTNARTKRPPSPPRPAARATRSALAAAAQNAPSAAVVDHPDEYGDPLAHPEEWLAELVLEPDCQTGHNHRPTATQTHVSIDLAPRPGGPAPEPGETVFSKRLCAAIERAGTNQRRLGVVTGIGGTVVNTYCRGKIRPQLDKLVILCRALGCSADYLLGLSDE